jgi:hypothetical protein
VGRRRRAEGNAKDLPPARQFADDSSWIIGTPDIVVKMQELVVKANAPDWWGEIASAAIPIAEDRYVQALQIREVNDVPRVDPSAARRSAAATCSIT